MKKLISIVLVLVLVFASAVPSFAYPHSDTELGALNEIEYWTYWIHQDFTGFFNDINGWLSSIFSRSESSLSNLLDINEYLRSVNSEITSLNDNLFGNMAFLQPFAQTIGSNSNTIVSKLTTLESGIAQLKEVLADDEDLAFKESQKENQQYIQDTFFKPGSDLSLNVSELTDFTSQFTNFTDSFDFIDKVGTSTSPLESISEGSDFSQWFTNETGQDMDPTFGGGSGGGGGEDSDPDPEPEPIKNWLPLATTEPGGTEIYNGIGYKPDTRWSTSGGGPSFNEDYCLSGWIPVSSSDIVYLYRILLFSGTATGSCYAVMYNDGSVSSSRIFNLIADDNGVYSYTIPDNVSYVRFSLGEFTSDSIISINQYPIQTASTFSLRAQSVPYEPEIVTSYYSDRMNEFYNLLGGDN